MVRQRRRPGSADSSSSCSSNTSKPTLICSTGNPSSTSPGVVSQQEQQQQRQRQQQRYEHVTPQGSLNWQQQQLPSMGMGAGGQQQQRQQQQLSVAGLPSSSTSSPSPSMRLVADPATNVAGSDRRFQAQFSPTCFPSPIPMTLAPQHGMSAALPPHRTLSGPHLPGHGAPESSPLLSMTHHGRPHSLHPTSPLSGSPHHRQVAEQIRANQMALLRYHHHHHHQQQQYQQQLQSGITSATLTHSPGAGHLKPGAAQPLNMEEFNIHLQQQRTQRAFHHLSSAQNLQQQTAAAAQSVNFFGTDHWQDRNQQHPRHRQDYSQQQSRHHQQPPLMAYNSTSPQGNHPMASHAPGITVESHASSGPLFTPMVRPFSSPKGGSRIGTGSSDASSDPVRDTCHKGKSLEQNKGDMIDSYRSVRPAPLIAPRKQHPEKSNTDLNVSAMSKHSDKDGNPDNGSVNVPFAGSRNSMRLTLPSPVAPAKTNNADASNAAMEPPGRQSLQSPVENNIDSIPVSATDTILIKEKHMSSKVKTSKTGSPKSVDSANALNTKPFSGVSEMRGGRMPCISPRMLPTSLKASEKKDVPGLPDLSTSGIKNTNFNPNGSSGTVDIPAFSLKKRVLNNGLKSELEVASDLEKLDTETSGRKSQAATCSFQQRPSAPFGAVESMLVLKAKQGGTGNTEIQDQKQPHNVHWEKKHEQRIKQEGARGDPSVISDWKHRPSEESDMHHNIYGTAFTNATPPGVVQGKVFESKLSSDLSTSRSSRQQQLPQQRSPGYSYRQQSKSSVIHQHPDPVHSESRVYASTRITAEQVAEAIPEHASSIFHILDRRINLDAHPADASFYSLLRAWVQDDPYRQVPPAGMNVLDYVCLPSERRSSGLDTVTGGANIGARDSKPSACDVLSKLSSGKISRDITNAEEKPEEKVHDSRNSALHAKKDRHVPDDLSTATLLSYYVTRAKRVRKRKRKENAERNSMGMKRLESLGIVLPPK